MAAFSNWILPCVIGGILLFGALRGISVFDVFVEGAKNGLKTAASITPALVCLMPAVAMFKSSGALDVLVGLFAPLAESIGAPAEVVPLAVLRPLSGSGALVLFRDILQKCGPDSFVGRAASVLEGSTETTFYTIAVYFGATDVQKTGRTLPAALSADLAGMAMSVLSVRLLFS